MPCWFVLIIFMGSPFLLPLSCRHSNILNWIKQLMGRCFQQYLRLCLPKSHSLCCEFRSTGPPCKGWVLPLTRNLGSMGTKTGADVVTRKLKVTDVFPTSETFQVRTRSAVLRQWTEPKTIAQLCLPDADRGAGCAQRAEQLHTPLWASAAFRLTSCNCSFSVWKQDDSRWLLMSKSTQGKEKKHSSCPCPNGEHGCEYITEKLGLKNSPSGLPAHQLE